MSLLSRITLLGAVLVCIASAGGAQNVDCIDNIDPNTVKLDDFVACLSKMQAKINALDADARTRISDLNEQLDLAATTTGLARAKSKEAEVEAESARAMAGRADALIEELERKLSDASEIVSLLEGVDGFEDFLATNSEFQKKIAELVVSVPSGTVAAFDLQDCPAGWRPFTQAAGRVVIGTGKGEGLTARSLRETDGAEKHRLTEGELPKHQHKPEFQARDKPAEIVGHVVGLLKDPDFKAYDLGKDGKGSQFSLGFSTAGFAGSDELHNNMQPFIALLFCKKEG